MVERWTGKETKALRHALRMTVQGFAEHLGVSPRTVSKWEARGSGIEPLPELQAALDTALHRAGDDAEHRFSALTSGAGLGPAIAARPQDDSANPSDDDVVRRRQLLQALGGQAALGVLTSAEGARRRAESHMSGHIDRVDLADWQRTAHAYSVEMGSLPPSVLAAQLEADLDELNSVLAFEQRTPVINDLLRVAAQLGCLLAANALAAGQFPVTRRWWRTSRRLAVQAGDAHLVAFILAQQAITGPYAGLGESACLQLADEALIATGDPCSGIASAHAARAQTLARLGRASESLAALARFSDVADALPRATGKPSWFDYSEQKFHHVHSYVETFLGQARPAQRAQDAALSAYHSTAYRGPAQIELHRALALVKQGAEIDGLDHAAAVLDGLPTEHRGDRFVEHIAHAVLAAVPAGGSQAARAREIRETLSAVS